MPGAEADKDPTPTLELNMLADKVNDVHCLADLFLRVVMESGGHRLVLPAAEERVLSNCWLLPLPTVHLAESADHQATLSLIHI